MRAQSYERSRFWYEKAAGKGDVDAIGNIGNMHVEGRGGIPKNAALALTFLERAAAMGSNAAAHNAAVILFRGADGVPADRARSMALLRTAAGRGNALSAVFLGYELLCGSACADGQPDFVEAERLFRQAAADGNETAAKLLEKLPQLRAELRAKGIAGV